MTNIQFLKDRIIIDGHAETKQECETITLLCDNLAKSKDFKTVRYESGYAEFEKVGQADELKFVSAPTEEADITLIWDSGITSVTGVPNDTGGSYTWTASNTTKTVTAIFGDYETITYTPVLKDGYVIDTVTTNNANSSVADTINIADDKKSFAVSLLYPHQYGTITITTKQATPVTKQKIDLSTLSGWANLANGSHQITVKAKASGYGDSAASNAVSVEKAAAGYTDCLTFTGKTSDFTLKATNGKVWDGTLEWSTDHNTWTTLVSTEEMQSVDKKLYLRGKNTTFYNSAKYKGVQWVLSAEADCTGNIQTLLDYEIKPTSISKDYCYYNMFRGCTNLTAAPELPATTLAMSCYAYMFVGCTSLTVAPELPATTLAEGCYYNMFVGCKNLTVAPELPATTLAMSCYYNMFVGCKNLKVNDISGNKIFTCPSSIPTDAVKDMFTNTGGTFTGTPTAGNTYYYTV